MIKIWAQKVYLFILKRLAQLELNKHKGSTIIGITGSAGKSSAKDLVVAFLLPHYGDELKYTKRGNSETGIPYELLNIPVKNYRIFQYPVLILKGLFTIIFSQKRYKVIVIEYGVDSPDSPKNMDYLLSIVKPDITALLSITSVHGEFFEKLLPEGISIAEKDFAIRQIIAKEKAQLLRATKRKNKAFITNQVKEYLPEDLQGFTALDSMKDISFEKWKNSTTGLHIACNVQGQLYEAVLPEVVLPTNAKVNFYFAIAVTLLLKKEIQKSFESFLNFWPIAPGRSSLLKGKNGSIIIDSSYNASPLAAIDALNLLKEVAKKEKRMRIAVLGDMRELGTATEAEHTKLVKSAKGKADILILTSPYMRKFGIAAAKEAGFVLNENLFWYENGKQLSFHITDHIFDHSVVLFEGSQNTVFLEYAVKEILENQDPEYIKTHLARMSDDWIKRK